MSKYKFRVKVSEKSDTFPGKTFYPLGFYYQDPYTVFVGDESSESTESIMILSELVEVEIRKEPPVLELLKEMVQKKENIIHRTMEELDNKIISYQTFNEFDYTKRCCGRKVVDFSSHYGSYGMGGPGFFGLMLEETEDYPEERIVLRLWGAAEWLLYNEDWMECHPDYYHIKKPLFSNFNKASWSKVNFRGMEITEIDVYDDTHSFSIVFDADPHKILCLPKDKSKLPSLGNGNKRREWIEEENVSQALILAHKDSVLKV